MTDNFMTVEPFEVQHGDILAGVPGANGHPVDQILQDGNDGWWIYASGGTILARRAPWSRVQVVRAETCEIGDPCPRCGRPLYAVEVTTREDPGPVFWPGCDCDPADFRNSPTGEAVGDSGRVELSSGDSPTATSDDCPPHGITRVRGLWMVTP